MSLLSCWRLDPLDLLLEEKPQLTVVLYEDLPPELVVDGGIVLLRASEPS